MNRLKQVREEKELTQRELEGLTGINKSVLNRIENGSRIMKTDEAELIAPFLGVQPEYLLNGESNFKAVRIPVLGEVIAGIPIEAVENIIDYEEIPVEQAKGGDYFALKIKGKSMEPRIFENDIVIIKKQSYCDDGDVAVVLINGEEATIKQVFKTKNTLTLIAFNMAVYTPHQYTDKECRELPIVIIGKVVEIRRKL